MDTKPFDPPFLGSGSSAAYNQWRVPNSYNWTVVGSTITTGNTPVYPMSKTITTRSGLLWIMASFQQQGQWDNWGAEPAEMPGGSAIGVRRFPIVIDTLYPITPGQHKIELKARLGQGRVEDSFDQDTDFYQIDSYQFIIIEIR